MSGLEAGQAEEGHGANSMRWMSSVHCTFSVYDLQNLKLNMILLAADLRRDLL